MTTLPAKRAAPGPTDGADPPETPDPSVTALREVVRALQRETASLWGLSECFDRIKILEDELVAERERSAALTKRIADLTSP